MSNIKEIMKKSGTFIILKKSGNIVKISPNQGTLHFCLFNVTKKSPNRRYQKRKQEEKKIKHNLKRKKTKTRLKELEGKKIDGAQKETLKIE